MQLANRLDKLPPYLFFEISRKIQEKRSQGADVVSFGIGDPDIPTPQHILDELTKTAQDSPNHRYPESDGLPELRIVVSFAKKYDVPVCHDAAYSEVTFDGYEAPSFMQTPGAKDVGIEFHSLSKTYNMTGWRVGMAVGNSKLIEALTRVKSNIDSGIPQAIQYMGIEALTKTTPEWIEANNSIYKRRRDRVVQVLEKIGLKVQTPKAGLYVWARCPVGWTSAELATELLDTHAVVVTPGRGYGEHGEGYIRLSLTTPDERVEEGLRRLEGWSLPNKPATN